MVVVMVGVVAALLMVVGEGQPQQCVTACLRG